MLHAGGIQTTGQWPAFEDEATQMEPFARAAWYRENEGRAIKVLDPHHWAPPPGLDYRVIWLDRAVKEQAKSQQKFVRAMTKGVFATGREQARGLERALVRERVPALYILRALSTRILPIQFETVLSQPLSVSLIIKDFLYPLGLNEDRAAGVVRKRGPACLPDFLEDQLVEEGEP